MCVSRVSSLARADVLILAILIRDSANMVRYIFAYLVLALLSSCDSTTGANNQQQQYQLIGEPIGHTAPENDPNDGKAIELAGGFAHVCARSASNRVKCWGDNTYGQSNVRSARDGRGKILDVSNAKFSKLVAARFLTCGIMQEAGYEDIPVCFGSEKLNVGVPHEKVNDIAAGPHHVCFAKTNGGVSCIGPRIQITTKDRNGPFIAAEDLPKHGIDKLREDLDFSSKTFTKLKAAEERLCGQGTDGIVYCMGGNPLGVGEPFTQKFLDFSLDDYQTSYILESGLLAIVGGRSANKFARISAPTKLKFKTFTTSGDPITAAGNYYDDGKPIPENTLLWPFGEVEEGVIDAVRTESKVALPRIGIQCSIKLDYKVVCKPYQSDEKSPEATTTPIIKDIPAELR